MRHESTSSLGLSDAIIERVINGLEPKEKHYLQLVDVAHEKDAKGRLTKKAKNARQALRNSFLNKTHVGRVKQLNNLATLEAMEERDSALKNFVAAELAYSRIRLQGDLLDGAQDGVPKSREAPDETLHDANAKAFVAALLEEGVPQSAFSRIVKEVIGPIAEIMKWAAKDPGFEDPRNLLRCMVQSGFLEAYCQRMDLTELIGEDAMTLLGDIAEYEQDPASFEAHRELEKRRGKPLDVSPRLAAGLLRLHQLHSDLSENQRRAMWFAADHRWSKQAVYLTRILGLSPTSIQDIQGVLSAVMCLRASDDKAEHEQELALVVYDLITFIDDLDWNYVPYEHWPIRFAAEALKSDRVASRSLPNEQAYNHLLAKLLERSRRGKQYDADELDDEDSIREQIRHVIIAQQHAESIGAVEHFVGEQFKPEHLHYLTGYETGVVDAREGPIAVPPADADEQELGWSRADHEAADIPSPRPAPDDQNMQRATSVSPLHQLKSLGPSLPKLPTMADLFKDDDDE
ncbi:hypothetical protein [Tsuneonella deserti]|uniref:hypothetical protein n=1 Tax=Tsuneonella deserti TaxID=2035528 RepID=UPI00166D68F7|nr:hypothetical protein [Tsuneonella deserti]